MVQQVTPMRPNQKTLVGTVVSDKMDKTVVVAVLSAKKHRLYKKTLRRTTRYKAHDPNNACKLGDTVRLVETRPISKEKRWRVVDILQRRDVAEVRPSTIGQELEQGRLVDIDTGATTPAADIVAGEVTDGEAPGEPEAQP